jgi:hypothetical protein
VPPTHLEPSSQVAPSPSPQNYVRPLSCLGVHLSVSTRAEHTRGIEPACDREGCITCSGPLSFKLTAQNRANNTTPRNILYVPPTHYLPTTTAYLHTLLDKASRSVVKQAGCTHRLRLGLAAGLLALCLSTPTTHFDPTTRTYVLASAVLSPHRSSRSGTLLSLLLCACSVPATDLYRTERDLAEKEQAPPHLRERNAPPSSPHLTLWFGIPVPPVSIRSRRPSTPNLSTS